MIIMEFMGYIIKYNLVQISNDSVRADTQWPFLTCLGPDSGSAQSASVSFHQKNLQKTLLELYLETSNPQTLYQTLDARTVLASYIRI
jgi:hypothetical protein